MYCTCKYRMRPKRKSCDSYEIFRPDSTRFLRSLFTLSGQHTSGIGHTPSGPLNSRNEILCKTSLAFDLTI